MVIVRKLIILLLLSFLFAAVASAQAVPFQCSAFVSVPPQLRSEGFTELVGDIFLSCMGGTPLALGTQIPTYTITVTMTGAATSRLLGTAGVFDASEALLLVDDPNTAAESPAPTYGNNLGFIPCGGPWASQSSPQYPSLGAGAGACTEYIGYSTAAGGTEVGGVPVASNPNTGAGGAFDPTPLAPAANVFQGIAGGQSVVFYGVPIAPPTTGDGVRTFRITNVRVNANAIAGGVLNSANANIALIVAPAPSSPGVPVQNSSLTVGYVRPSLSTSITNPFSTGNAGLAATTTLRLSQAYPTSGNTPVALETLVFSELSSDYSAFHKRGSTSQNVPGEYYFGVESGLTVGTLTGSTPGGTATAGYADWGTRLKAVFSNIPSGVNLYVSTVNLNSNFSGPMGSVANAGSLTGSSFAQLITSVTLTNNFTPWAPVVSAAGTAASSVTGGAAASPIPYAPLTVVNGSATAVWEVMNGLANAPDTLAFAVFVTSNSSSPQVAPAPMTVNLSYAPIPTQGAFTLAAGMQASNALGIPRAVDSSTSLTAAAFLISDPTPALSPWALGVLAILLMALGMLLMRKRCLDP